MTPPSSSLALLAGGLAKRMRPFTDSTPKSLLEVAGEPFINHQLRLLKRENIVHVVICAGHLGEKIQDAVGDGSQFGLSVSYSFDGEKLLGTGGSILKALPSLGEVFWVMYGDSYLDISFPPILSYFQSENKTGLMTVFENGNRWDSSNVVFKNGRIVDYKKGLEGPDVNYIDFGLGIFRESAFSSWNTGESFDLSQVYKHLVLSEDLLGYEVNKRFYEVGTPSGL